MALSSSQDAALHGLMGSLDDVTLMRLNAALGAARGRDALFAPVSDIARKETLERQARDLVLEPLKPLADPALVEPKTAILDRRDVGLVWWIITKAAPEETARVRVLAQDLRSQLETRPLFNGLCARAAAALASGAYDESITPPARLKMLSDVLKLSPILRDAQHSLNRWVRNLGSDHMAAVRLCYKDAMEIGEDMATLLVECLFIYLEEPHHIIRLISAMLMERPSDRFLAASELAGLGERLLKDIEAKLAVLRRFDPLKGPDHGAATAADVRVASLALTEFEQWITLSRDGPWGARVMQLRRRLASEAESLVRAAEAATAKALPLHYERQQGGLAPRLAPLIEGYPDEALQRRAEGVAAFIAESGSFASEAGFGAVRAKTLEALETYIDRYVDELVERMRAGDLDPDWAKAHLETAADITEIIGGTKKATIARRRAAVL